MLPVLCLLSVNLEPGFGISWFSNFCFFVSSSTLSPWLVPLQLCPNLALIFLWLTVGNGDSWPGKPLLRGEAFLHFLLSLPSLHFLPLLPSPPFLPLPPSPPLPFLNIHFPMIFWLFFCDCRPFWRFVMTFQDVAALFVFVRSDVVFLGRWMPG